MIEMYVSFRTFTIETFEFRARLL